MDKAGRSERGYRSPLRDEQARRTRAAIVAAARTRFVANGYGSTTLQQVADEAGVSVQTVYATFGNKASLLQHALDVAIAGDDRPITVNRRDWMHAVFHDPDAEVRLHAYAAAVRRIHEAAADMFAVIKAAAAADPALRDLADDTDERRRRGAASVVDGLAAMGALRAGLSRRSAVDIVWTMNSVDVFVLLVRRAGWSLKRYEQWLGATLVQQLL
jgi:AcrR family transcriptional regulator